jgi:hypothetical protein
MANFFFRTPGAGLAQLKAYGTGVDSPVAPYYFKATIGAGTVRSGGNSSFSLGSYKGTSTGYLTSATVTVEGDFGSLVRAEINFKCHVSQLNAVDKDMMQLGYNVSVSYGRTGGGSGSGNAGSFSKMKVYDHSFTINADDTVDCKIKAVGQGQELFDRALTENPGVYSGTAYRTSYRGSTSVTTKTAFDFLSYLDGRMQSATGQIGSSDAFEAPDGGDASIGYYIRFNDDRGDQLFGEGEFDFDGDNDWADARGIYYSFGAILSAISLQSGFDFKLIGCGGGELKMYYVDNFIPSANPLECIFPYGANGDGNFYKWDRGYVSIETDPDKGYAAHGDCSVFNLGAGGVLDVLFNRSALVALLRKEGAQDQSLEGESQPKMFITVQSFFEKVFSMMKQNSGGAIDLALVLDPAQAQAGSAKQYIILNKKNAETFPSPGTISKGMKGVLEINITSKVPSKAAAAAFAQNDPAGNRSSEDQKAGSLISSKAGASAGAAYGTQTYGWQVSQAMFAAQGDNFKGNGVQELQSVLKKMVGGESPTATAARGHMVWPLELTLRLLGCHGWVFGDTLKYNQLPDRYKTNGSAKIGFTVTRAQQKFGKEWETELTTVCRFIGA